MNEIMIIVFVYKMNLKKQYVCILLGKLIKNVVYYGFYVK